MEKNNTNSAKPIALIVDDEPLILMDMADMIADEGFAVLEARSADEALELIEENPSLKLVFTDVQMPGELNGFDLARIISDRWPHVCLVVASGAAVPKAGDLPSKACFVSKPVSSDRCHSILRDHCRLTH